MEFKEAFEKFRRELEFDNELYRAYKANIAMSFVDEYYRNDKRYKNRRDMHEIANKAAANFLNLLIGTRL